MQYKKTKILNYNFGFTLSEVLITLGIIGVVAALTIPTIINNANDAAFNSGAKKALSIANQAYKIAYLENGSGFGPFSDNTQAAAKFNALKSQLKVIKDCPYNTSPQGKCWSSSGVGLKNYLVTGCQQTSNDGNQFVNTAFTTADGMFWMFYSYSAVSGVNWFFVDVNGNKGPNDWGKDVFLFKMNDTDISPHSTDCGGNLKHNDGSSVSATEFTDPFVK